MSSKKTLELGIGDTKLLNIVLTLKPNILLLSTSFSFLFLSRKSNVQNSLEISHTTH